MQHYLKLEKEGLIADPQRLSPPLHLSTVKLGIIQQNILIGKKYHCFVIKM